MKNKKGSSIVLLSIVFVAFCTCISASIVLARSIVVKSECEVFGKIWGRAILSEYDVHLLEDYGLMAYFGNEIEVQKRLDMYIEYSCTNKLDANINNTEAFLAEYELCNPEVFLGAIKKAFSSDVIKKISGKNQRDERDELSIGQRAVRNEVVIDTLPSKGIENALDIEGIVKEVKECDSVNEVINKLGENAIEIEYIHSYLNNYLSCVGDKDTYFNNEMEYIVAGKLEDKDNYYSCRRRIFLIRNALNLAAIYKDQAKVEMITAIAEIITPGAGSVTQVLIAETWAALEAEEDLKTLYDGGRVPLNKEAADWKLGLESVLGTDSFVEKLDEESKELLKEKQSEIIGEIDLSQSTEISEGLNYDEYLLILIALVNKNIRLLRTMDIIQINMKYWYYDDFNMAEYYTGVDFFIKANGRKYEIEDYYK